MAKTDGALNHDSCIQPFYRLGVAVEDAWHGRLQEVGYACAYCGEPNQTYPDPGGGEYQELIEDCRVCCRPNVVIVSKNGEGDCQAEGRSEDE
jgi:hypothetical protein